MKIAIQKMTRGMAVCLAVTVGFALSVNPVQADEVADLARNIMEKWQDAVVVTRFVVEVYESERKIEGLATVIDPSGLAIISLSSIDPSSMWSSSLQESKVKDVKMIMPDNSEIPAKILLRDQDLDLAFIQPTEKEVEPMLAVDLSDNAVPNIFEQVVILARLGTIAGNVPTISSARVQAILEKPRTMYMPDPFTSLVSGMGTPAFSIDGKVLGILLLRVSKSEDIYTNEMSGGIAGLGMLPVIIPANEILEVIKKSPELRE